MLPVLDRRSLFFSSQNIAQIILLSHLHGGVCCEWAEIHFITSRLFVELFLYFAVFMFCWAYFLVCTVCQGISVRKLRIILVECT